MTAITILDGGMGQELVARSGQAPTPLWSTRVMMDAPGLVRAVHDDYFRAGAEIATTNSYAIHRDRLDPRGLGYRFAELHEQACRLAVEARDAHGAGRVAGSAGPLGGTYLGDDGPPYDEAAARFDEIARIQAPFVDLFLAESVPSVARARAALDGLSGHGRPVWLAVTVDDEDGTRLRSGEPVAGILDLIAERPVAALLVNCSLPEAVTQALAKLRGASLPLGAYANGFTHIPESFRKPGATVDLLRARDARDPAAYADFAARWAGLGATIVGGCCEVGPAHIARLRQRLSETPA